ncbi:MAG: DUF3990 domain-containing protein [Synergistaceae bacterium]|jgi:hypothetical protein|nr:DUF3990 domain-containing protein [Synergistaceae bacterium]
MNAQIGMTKTRRERAAVFIGGALYDDPDEAAAEKKHGYDIVAGPTANDNTRNSIDLFIGGYLGDEASDDAMNILLQLLKPRVLPRQFLFASEKAAACLKLIRREKL